MRVSHIPKRGLDISISSSAPDKSNASCVRCHEPVTPGFCRTGSVLAGLQFTQRSSTETLPVIGTIETPFKTYVLGGEQVEKVKRIGFNRRERGFICDSCAGEYKLINGQPLVKVDPAPGYIGETARGAFIPEVRNNKPHASRPIVTRGAKIFD